MRAAGGRVGLEHGTDGGVASATADRRAGHDGEQAMRIGAGGDCTGGYEDPHGDAEGGGGGRCRVDEHAADGRAETAAQAVAGGKLSGGVADDGTDRRAGGEALPDFKG